ncbi:hypothetical protein [Chlamydiifrater phoenicopteri]|uniref:hypothetical protein n=1 Tax=Chlamydiifrater phoenicopteri TaxID=2681469 RepID=UPI001BCF7001|nr:hypothetical protein [Chlamydiifrater phoenicopteri]
MSSVQGVTTLPEGVATSLNAAEQALLDRVEKLEKSGRKTLLITALLTMNLAFLVANSASVVLTIPSFLCFILNLVLVVLCAYFLIKMILKKKPTSSREPSEGPGFLDAVISCVRPVLQGFEAGALPAIIKMIVEYVAPLFAKNDLNRSISDKMAEEDPTFQEVPDKN